MHGSFKEIIEYTLARLLLQTFGLMPRPMAHRASRMLAWLGFHLARRQRRAGIQNLRMAMPSLSDKERRRILRGCFQNLGRLLVEFSHFPELSKGNISQYVFHDGLEHYLEGLRRGRGIIFMAAHFGAWELSSFAHSLYGYPRKFIVSPIDNPRIDNLISHYRTMGGNLPIQRRIAGRDILKSLRQNEAFGHLLDQNTTSDEGVFIDFIGIPAAAPTAIS